MKENIDESLYSRQLYVLGYDAMQKMQKSSVLVLGADGLAQEVMKNLCLAGIKKLTLHDKATITIRDLCTGFYFTEEDVGKRRDFVIAKRLKELNSYVEVEVMENLSNFDGYTCIVTCNYSYHDQVSVNNICRRKNIYYVGCQEKGVFSQVFCDFGKDFLIIDPTGETPIIGVINDIDNSGVLTTIENERHNLEDKDLIKITENPSYENLIFEVEVINPHKLKLKPQETENESFTFEVTQGGYFEQQKKPKVLTFKRLEDAVENPEILNFDYVDNVRSHVIHKCFMTLNLFELKFGRMPIPRSKNDAKEFYSLFGKEFGECEERKELITNFALQCATSLMPICSIVGGFTAQEVLKACSAKFHPLFQFLYFDSESSLPKNLDQENFSLENSRYDPLIQLFGRNNLEKLFKLKLLIVGAGAIGCEHLKNLAMLGCGKKGKLFVTDMDSIEHSNLNRQFLFRISDVTQMKASVACREIKKINPDVKTASFNLKVGTETENIFNQDFFSELTFVANALDNIEARIYIDERCIFFRKPLFDSGTLGTKGNSQVIIPFKTESYSSSRDPPEKGIPLCTIRNFPHLIEHTIEWALNEFNSVFCDQPTSLSEKDKWKDEDTIALAKQAPTSPFECIENAYLLFKKYFYKSILTLIETFPADHKTDEGLPFWTPPKRAPTPLEFDCTDPLHFLFILSASNLYAQAYGIKEKINNEKVLSHLKGLVKLESIERNNGQEIIENLVPIKFDKDNDSDFHVDFIYACSNLRANNYKIQNASRHSVKGIAGRIIPAIATTTALVSGISILEMLKHVFNADLEDFKNAFVNLAIPFFATSTPIGPSKKEYHFNKEKKYSYTLWDRIELLDMQLKNFLAYFKKTHNVEILMLMVDGSIKYNKASPSNLDKYISELTEKDDVAIVDALFDTDCEDFPPILVDLRKKGDLHLA